MNERIRELALQAGYVPLEPRTFADDLEDIFLKKFAELVRAEEREECAKVCDIEAAVTVTNVAEQYQEGRSMGAAVCATAIRARGET